MSGPEKKSDTVRRLVRERDYRSALRIVKDFRLGICKTNMDAMRRAYECMVNPGFYRQLGLNPATEIKCGVDILVSLYGAVQGEGGEYL